ncbi:MAG: hypothetical protein ACTSR0_04215 [Candidatus Asgardarchaeia archaeon]
MSENKEVEKKGNEKKMGLDEIIARRYSSIANIPYEEARAILQELKERDKADFERVANTLALMAEFGDKVQDPLVSVILKPMLEKTVSGGDDVTESISSSLKEVTKYVTTLKALDALLPQKKENEELKAMLEQYQQTILQALQSSQQSEDDEKYKQLMEEIKALKSEIANLKVNPTNNKVSLETIVNAINDEVSKAKKLLSLMGYRLEKGITIDEAKRIAEEHGLKVVEDKIPISELEKMKKAMMEEMEKRAKEAYEKGKQDALKEVDTKVYEKQIEAVENIFGGALDKFISNILTPIVKKYLGMSEEEEGEI